MKVAGQCESERSGESGHKGSLYSVPVCSCCVTVRGGGKQFVLHCEETAYRCDIILFVTSKTTAVTNVIHCDVCFSYTV